MPIPNKLEVTSDRPDYIDDGDDFIPFEYDYPTPMSEEERDQLVAELLNVDEEVEKSREDILFELSQMAPPPLANLAGTSEQRIATLDEQVADLFMSDELIL